MNYDREKCERLMKVCQKGYPASNIHVEYANNTLAECYALIGAMMIEIDREQKDAERMDWMQAAYGGHGNEAGFHLSMFIDGASENDDLREMIDGAIYKAAHP